MVAMLKTIRARALLTFLLVLPVAALLRGAPAGTADWPMWGGTPNRNMVSDMKGLPISWDVRTGRNVKWVAELGSQSYGNAVVANGMVFVGTNNEGVRDPAIVGDRGVLMAFRESDGEFLWQMVHEKLPQGRVNDWPYQGIASSPLAEDNRLYYVSNRAEVVCLDLTTGGRGRAPDILWQFDMIEEVGAHPHNLANSSPIAFGDLLYLTTSNGQDESHVNIPSPRAPSIIALDKHTGELVWEDNSVGENILHGQWSPPTVGRIGGVDQVVHGQGDGWVRGYDALTGKKLWEFDTNPKDSVWPKTRNELISTPVIHDDVVFIANGQDPEHGEGVGHLYAIDATRRGDITDSGRLWHYDKIRRSISTPAIRNGLIYYPDFSGFLHCLDARTGEVHWVHDLFAAVWGSPLLADGKLYLGDEDGDVVILREGKALDVIDEINMGSSVYSTPVPANGVLFISTRNQLFALAEGASLKK
jgi:outer membrane protein assembly factor BamB